MDKAKRKRRAAFRSLAFDLQIATGERAESIIEDMIHIMGKETDVIEKEEMKRTIVSNADHPAFIELSENMNVGMII